MCPSCVSLVAVMVGVSSTLAVVAGLSMLLLVRAGSAAPASDSTLAAHTAHAPSSSSSSSSFMGRQHPSTLRALAAIQQEASSTHTPHASVQLASMRDDLMRSRWMSDTSQSSSNSMAFLRNFPRKKADGSAGTNQLQRLGGPFNRTAANAAEADPIADYVASMFFMYGVPLFFAMLAIVCWAGFCISRCWCNACGRHATVLYTDKQVHVNYALTAALIVVMGVCAAFGWTGNVQVSKGLDASFVAANDIANYAYEFMGIASTAYDIGYNAVLLGTSFNASLAILPQPHFFNGSALCVADSYVDLQAQGAFVESLRNTTIYFTNDSTSIAGREQAAAGVGGVQDAMDTLATPLVQAPAGGTAGQSLLQNLQQQLTALNASLAGLPNSAMMEQIITHLTSVKTIDAAAGTSVQLALLATQFSILYSSANTVAPSLNSLLASLYSTLEAGIQSLGSSVSNATALTPSTSASDASALNTSYAAILHAWTTDFPQDWSGFRSSLNALSTNLRTINATLPLLQSLMLTYQSTAASPSHWPASSNALYSNLTTKLGPLANFQTNFGKVLQSVLATELPALIVRLAHMHTGIPAALGSFSSIQAQVAAIRAHVDVAGTKSLIQSFNQTAGRISCFVDILHVLQDVNASLVIIPSAVSDAQFVLQPLLEKQAADLPSIYANMTRAVQELAVVEATLAAGGQPDFAAITSALNGLSASLASMYDYAQLWSELVQLAQVLYDVTSADGVVVAYGSGASALWPNVTSVSARSASAAAGGYSSLDKLVDLFNAVQMSSELSALATRVNALQSQLSGAGLSATFLDQMSVSLDALGALATSMPAQLRAALPVSLPLATDVRDSLVTALASFTSALAARPSNDRIQLALGSSGLNSTLGDSSAKSDFALLDQSLLGLRSSLKLASLTNMAAVMRALQTNATLARMPTLTQVLTGAPAQLVTLQAALDPSGVPLQNITTNNVKLQNLYSSYLLTGTNGVLLALDTSAVSLTNVQRDGFVATLAALARARGSFPDFDAKVTQGLAGLDALSSALDWMLSNKIVYQRTSNEWKNTVDQYDGVRLLVFNLGAIAPFLLSFLLLLAGLQHYGCPAMVAGLTFFPLFVLFMCMAAVQMPVSVALSDHCYNQTGEIKIQTTGRVRRATRSAAQRNAAQRSTSSSCASLAAPILCFVLTGCCVVCCDVCCVVCCCQSYPAEKIAFFGLSHDIDVPSVVDYFTECAGAAPEFLTKLAAPLALLQANGLESATIQNDTRTAIGLQFAPPMLQDFQQLDALQKRSIDMLNSAVTKLNCSRSSLIYHTAMSAVCTDFAPAFALTTCVFLLAGLCMVPGICIGITSYKRFNPLNRHATYRQARGDDEQQDDMAAAVAREEAGPEGWN